MKYRLINHQSFFMDKLSHCYCFLGFGGEKIGLCLNGVFHTGFRGSFYNNGFPDII